MLTSCTTALETRARAVADAIARPEVDVVPCTGKIGGGSAPTAELDSRAVRVQTPRADDLLALLRDERIIARIGDGAVLLDLRCVDPADDARLTAALRAALARL